MNLDTYIAPVFNKLLDKAERHIKYIVSTSSYVVNLQKKREVLNARKNDINGRIDEGERKLQRPAEEVLVWRNQAVDMLDRIDAALNKAQETSSCFCLVCSKHKLGHSCDDMIKEVDELLERASLFHNAEMVDRDTSHVIRSIPDVVAGSQESYFAEARNCIEDENSKANIIGIWGPGGVGKTTLLSKIHDHFVGTSSMFETVIWTVASSEQSDVSRVQSEIIKKLRLKEDNDVQSQADIIKNYLENKNFLLFIDDLWKDVDLRKVGVPNIANEGNPSGKKRKVIFTTRFKDVCGKMDARKIIEVKCLDPTQSLTLFIEKVGEEVIQSHPGIPELAEDIVKECKGLPLALIVIGRAMSTKSNIDDWKSTLFLLKNSQGHHVSGVDEQLLSILKVSYDNLATEQLRKCFLTISLWPEDHMIGTNELIDFWMGINLIDSFESKHELHRFGHSLIRRLQVACLLEDVGYHYYPIHDEALKMHDVLRDLALWLASECGKNKNKWMVKAGNQLQKAPNRSAKWEEAECISLMGNKIKELPSDIPSCPSLLTLVLKGNYLKDELNGLGKFNSLFHLDLSQNSPECFPESICDLTELRYLNLSRNEITNLPVKLRNLKMLKYLILRVNRITNIPKGVFSELTELLVLDMFGAIDFLKYPLVDVEELKSIKKKLISFGTSVRTEEELSKLILLYDLPIDFLLIAYLHSTTFHFMAMIRNACRLKELRMQQCYSGLSEIVFDKNETDQEIASTNLETLKLSLINLKRIIWNGIAPEILFAELRTVIIECCEYLMDITWVIHLPSLKYLELFGCKRMRIAVNDDVDPQVLTFPSLQFFSLWQNKGLEKISLRSLAFPQLKQLVIVGSPLLKSLPLEVQTTPKLIRIQGDREWWEKVEWEDDNSRSHFNQIFQPY